MKYEVEITFKHIVTVDADCDEQAIKDAASVASQQEPVDGTAMILRRHHAELTTMYDIGDHFMGLGGEFFITGLTPNVVFYDEIENPTLEGSMMDRKVFEDCIQKGFIFNRRKETLIEKAKRLIDNYCCLEFKERAKFTDLSRIPIAHTTTEDTNLPIQVNVDLISYNVCRYISDIPVEIRHYSTLEQLIEEELQSLDFDELVWFSDELLAKFCGDSTSNEPAPPQISMDTHGATIANTPGTWRVVDHIEVEGHTFWLMDNEVNPKIAPIIVDNDGFLCVRNARHGFNPNNRRLLALEVLNVPFAPDDAYTPKQMKQYGYSFGGMLPLGETAAKMLYAENCSIYCLYFDDTEALVEDPVELARHASCGGLFGIEKVDWLSYLQRQEAPHSKIGTLNEDV